MSLSATEIDRVLSELGEGPWKVVSVGARGYHRYHLNLIRSGSRLRLSLCLQQPFLRVAVLDGHLDGPHEAHRFLARLRRELVGRPLARVEHHLRERILRLDFPGYAPVHLWVRLWGGAANAFLTDTNLVVLDAAFLRPQRGEVPASVLELPHQPSGYPSTTREFPGSGSYSERLEAHYRTLEREQALRAAVARYSAWLEGQIGAVRSRLEALAELEGRDGEAERHHADLILANVHRIRPGAAEVEVEDWDGTPVRLALDPRLGPAQNAQALYERARKLAERRQRAQQERAELTRKLGRLEEARRHLQQEPGDWVLDEARRIRKENRPPSAAAMGLKLDIRGYTVLVGRNARENDHLLRSAVKGRDHWLHVRDWPGGFVFVRCPAGKSVPLDVLLDAAQLAAHFSKARHGGEVDLFWTRVKYLRRVKGELGKVIPTQEKNLTIRTDPERVRALLGGEGAEVG